MSKKIALNSLLICLLLILSSCNSPSPTQIDNSPTQIDNPPTQIDNPVLTSTVDNSNVLPKDVKCVFETISPATLISEIVSFSGDSAQSQTFSLNSETSIRVYWNQVSKKSFLLSTTNLDPNLANSPDRSIVFESYVGPSSGCADATLSAGNYQINIENADSSWTVWVQTINYIK